MTTIIPKRLLSGLNFGVENFSLFPVYLVFLFVLLYQPATSQICDKKTMVFFESDQYSIPSTEEKKLRSLTNQFSQKNDTFLLEIYAFTDSIASVDYNYKLAQNRFKTIVSYLKKNSAAHFEIIEKVRGEAAPLNTNATEEGRAKNRRVEIFYFKINGGRVTLKGKGGMEMAVGKDYFSPCGICETNPKITEIFSDGQAAQAGIPLITSEGCQLTTGGMISLGFDCKSRPQPVNGQVDEKYCADIEVKIPATLFDEEMEIWNAKAMGTKSMSKWFRDANGEMNYDEKAKMYTLKVRFCPGAGINIDKLAKFQNTVACRDSSGVIVVPELIRPRRLRNYWLTSSTILTKEGENIATLAKFSYRGRGPFIFIDSGMTKQKVGYYFSGNILPYVMECDSGRCKRRLECWCYEIPLSAYTKIIYFQKKKDYRLKIPRKYRNYSVRLFIPAADSTIIVNKVNGSRRKYTFQQPLPDTYVVLYKEGSNPNNKRGYDYQVDLEKVKKKYSKRKKVYKAKIKRKQLKHSV